MDTTTNSGNSKKFWRYGSAAAIAAAHQSDDEDLDVNNRLRMNVDDEDEEEEILEMDFESGHDDRFEETYQAKCGSHPRHRWRGCQAEAAGHNDDDDELSESDQKLVHATIGSVRPDHIQCNCLNARCKIVRYLKKSHHGNAMSTSSSASSICQKNDLSTMSPPKAKSLKIDKEEFRRVHQELILLAGGKEKSTKVYEQICKIANGQTRVNSKSNSNTALMQLCSTTFKDESDPTRSEERSMLYAQIYAIIKLYMDLDPEALFVRNVQDAGALELAALTNKVVVTKYLVMLYTIYGRDVNAPNQRGHTLLHLLARKGDDCSDTIEMLLAMKVFSEDGTASQRLLRMDVLNEGKKTPLDVATACIDLFSCGKDRTLYTRVISIFHNAIEEEARQLVSDTQHRDSKLTFRNAF